MTIADLKLNRLNISHVKRPIQTKLKCKQGQRKNLKQIMFSNANAHRNLISVLKSLIESTSSLEVLEADTIFTFSLKMTLIASDMNS